MNTKISYTSFLDEAQDTDLEFLVNHYGPHLNEHVEDAPAHLVAYFYEAYWKLQKIREYLDERYSEYDS